MANRQWVSTILCVGIGCAFFALGCEGEKGGAAAAGSATAKATGATTAAMAATTAAAAAPAGDTPCSAVVDKLASYEKTSGEPEKKLWGKMCEAMPPAARACIVASKTAEERDKCMAGAEKPFK
jgi:hypothetical protein